MKLDGEEKTHRRENTVKDGEKRNTVQTKQGSETRK